MLLLRHTRVDSARTRGLSQVYDGLVPSALCRMSHLLRACMVVMLGLLSPICMTAVSSNVLFKVYATQSSTDYAVDSAEVAIVLVASKHQTEAWKMMRVIRAPIRVSDDILK